jgi:ferrous-iron efflux pump FieF
MAMAFSLLMTLLLLSIQRIAVAKTGSLAIQADSLHYKTDLLSNGTVLLTLWMVTLGVVWLDPVMALLVAGYVLFSAWKIAISSIDQLMDKQLPPHVESEMLAAAQSVTGVVRAHQLRSRQSGATYLVQLYIDLSPDMTVRESHVVGDAVKAAIVQIYPNADVLVHEEPAQI